MDMSEDKIHWWTWTKQKLLSRKWWLVAGTVAISIGLDIAGRALEERTLQYLAVAVPAYLAVEGALDWAYKRKQRNGGDE